MGQTPLVTYGFETDEFTTTGETDKWLKNNTNSSSVINTNQHRNGEKSFIFSAGNNTAPNPQTIVSPIFESSSNITVSLYYKLSSGSSTQRIRIGVSTSTDRIVSDNSWTWSDYQTISNTSWAPMSYSPNTSGVRCIAIQYDKNGLNYTNGYIDDISVTVPASSSCDTPTDLLAEATSSTTADISWTAGGSETEWLLYYSTSSTDPDDDLYSGTGVVTGIDATSYTLENLKANTTYYVWVRAKCGQDDYSSWSEMYSFPTPCEALSLPYSNGFEVGDDNLSCWEIRNGATNTGIYEGEGYNSSAYSFYFQYTGTNKIQYLVTPNLSDDSKILNVELYCKRGIYSGNTATIYVGYSTTDNKTESFEWVSTSSTLSTEYTLCQYILHDDDNDNIKYIAVKFDGPAYNNHIYIDDLTITAYDKLFVGAYWDNLRDWAPEGLPKTTDAVLINRPATIREDDPAVANEIKLGPSGSLTIEDGGQLICNNSVAATFQKEITAYTIVGGKDNYYLIANPTTSSIDPENVDGMLDETGGNDYDLYYFDEAQSGAEWRNYKQEVFNLVNGKGYLYANSSNLTLEFPGTVLPGTTANITLSKSGSGTYNGFNLVGNPLSNNVTSMKIGESSCSYYKVNSSTGVFAVSTDPIIVGEAFMVEAPSNGATLQLNPSAKDEAGFTNEVIRLEVSNSKFTDVAYVYFGNHLPLTKINHLNDEAPMLYIHNENSDKAVEVYNNRGEVKSINVNFEAKTIGTYTISAKMVKGEIKYMHLYDRFTGIDTDLLIDDYSFIGANEDQPGRFILKLEAIDNEFEGSDNFAYQSGNNIMVNGEGELQIFDVMGRMVMNERINGVESISGLSRGIYIFRVIGETQKTQKIVVR